MTNKIDSMFSLRERSHIGGDVAASDYSMKRSSSSVGKFDKVATSSTGTVSRSQDKISAYNNDKKLISHDFRLRLSLLSFKSKIVLCVVMCLIAIQLLVSAADTVYQYSKGKTKRLNVIKEAHFAVVINTYKRPEMLREAVQHYGEICGRRMGVGQVIVVWADLQSTPPQPEALLSKEGFLKTSGNEKKHRSQVQIVRATKDSLNSRFMPIHNLKSHAVFMVDDDVRVDCQSLKLGFQAWKANPYSMVGYYPRLAAVTRENRYVYQAWPIVWWRQSINFVLTKASFFHSDYLSLYSDASKHPVEILKYVDTHMNCEDVAFSMLVANSTTTSNFPMIYVEGNVHDRGLFKGISTKKGGVEHMDARSRCLDDLTKIYESHGWSRPLDPVFALPQASWVAHITGWQYRPSNLFEWFALENIFK